MTRCESRKTRVLPSSTIRNSRSRNGRFPLQVRRRGRTITHIPVLRRGDYAMKRFMFALGLLATVAVSESEAGYIVIRIVLEGAIADGVVGGGSGAPMMGSGLGQLPGLGAQPPRPPGLAGGPGGLQPPGFGSAGGPPKGLGSGAAPSGLQPPGFGSASGPPKGLGSGAAPSGLPGGNSLL